MYRRILVASDLSEASLPALRAGLDLARRMDAEVILLHVTEPPFDPPRWHVSFRERVGSFDSSDLEKVKTAARRALEKFLEDAQEHLRERISARVEVVSGQPAPAITAMARELGADLVVVGTHGRTGLSHAILGSVAEKVVRSAPCAVLTVRSSTKKGE